MDKKHTQIKFLSLIICMLVIASSITLTMAKEAPLQATDKLKTTNNGEVDSRVHLTMRNIPLLQKAFKRIDEPRVKLLLQIIITELNKERTLSSQGLQQIIDELNFPFIITTGRLICNDFGVAHIFPGFIISKLKGYIGPVIIGSWPGGLTYAGFHRFEDVTLGFFIGFFGIVDNGDFFGSPMFCCIGLSLLTIIII